MGRYREPVGIIGLTGGVGSGKSTVAALLAEHGAFVVDADAVAREVVAPGSAGLQRVAAAFGPDVLAADGTLDRPRLGALVFRDTDALARLNAILHPLIAQRTGELFAAAPPGAVLVHDVPLLVENGLAPAYERVVVVLADDEVRLARLAARGMAPDEARRRMAAQATDEARLAVADEVLRNDGDRADLRAQVDALWARIIDKGPSS